MDIRATIFGGPCWRNNIIQGCICFYLFIYLFFWQFTVGLFKKKNPTKLKKKKQALSIFLYKLEIHIPHKLRPLPEGPSESLSLTWLTWVAETSRQTR